VEKRGRVTANYPYGKGPIATYIFRYRTRSKSTNTMAPAKTSAHSYTEDLEIEGIVERPVPLEERDPEDLTPGEAREQVRLLREAASRVKVKQESKREKRARSVTLGADENVVDGDDDVTITGVTDRHKRAKASPKSIEVLDLTED
jgi:RecB family exonuclease